MKKIEVQVIITGIRARSDGSLGLSLTTPELTPEEKAEFMRLQNNNLTAFFIPLDEVNVPEYKVDKDLEMKTPSQRLRGTLYKLWEQNGSDGDYDSFYKTQMERFIEAVKSKLNEY